MALTNLENFSSKQYLHKAQIWCEGCDVLLSVMAGEQGTTPSLYSLGEGICGCLLDMCWILSNIRTYVW